MSAITEPKNFTEPADPLQDTRQRLVEAAWKAFSEEGFRVSIDRIAARAQMARQTLYNHFSSKDALFGEVIRHVSRAVLVTLEGGNNVRDTLIAFAEAYREKVLSPDGIAIFRTLTSEAAHFPELAAQVFREGPLGTRQRLAIYLAREMEAGHLRRDEPLFAAEMLTAMLADFDRLRCLMTFEMNQNKPDKSTQVVDCFLRAFAPEPAVEKEPP
jgi:TetR/AcrR family transcriptional repressor of mexJK operon